MSSIRPELSLGTSVPNREQLVTLLGEILVNVTIVLRSWMYDGYSHGDARVGSPYWLVNEWLHELAGAIQGSESLSASQLKAYVQGLLDTIPVSSEDADPGYSPSVWGAVAETIANVRWTEG